MRKMHFSDRQIDKQIDSLTHFVRVSVPCINTAGSRKVVDAAGGGLGSKLATDPGLNVMALWSMMCDRRGPNSLRVWHGCRQQIRTVRRLLLSLSLDTSQTVAHHWFTLAGLSLTVLFTLLWWWLTTAAFVTCCFCSLLNLSPFLSLSLSPALLN